MKKPTQATAAKIPQTNLENFRHDQSAGVTASDPTQIPRRLPSYAFDEQYHQTTFVVQTHLLQRLLRHLRAKKIEAWSIWSNVISGEIIATASPNAIETALGDFREA